MCWMGEGCLSACPLRQPFFFFPRIVPFCLFVCFPRTPATTRAPPPPSSQAGFTEHNKLVSATKMLVVGGLTAGAAYLIGWGLGAALGVDTCS